MATPTLIPEDRTVYRGMQNQSWSKRGVVNYRAFMLRPADDIFPIEEELSLGVTPESAVNELKEHFGIAGLAVLRINLLPHGLSVRPNPQDATKAEMYGLPLFGTDATQRGLALAVATDLASIAYLIPTVPTPNELKNMP